MIVECASKIGIVVLALLRESCTVWTGDTVNEQCAKGCMRKMICTVGFVTLLKLVRIYY